MVVSKTRLQDSDAENFIPNSKCVWYIGNRLPYVDSTYISWFSHHLAPRIVSRVEKLGVKLWQLASRRRRLLRNRLPARCFLRGPKWRLSLSTTLVSGYGWEVMSSFHYIWTSHRVFTIFLDPSRSTWLASKLQQTPAWTSSILIFGTDALYDGIVALASQMDKCLNVNDDSVEVWCVPSNTRCHVLMEVRMKFSVSRGFIVFKTPLYFHFTCG
jgi:hypothetical protein